MLSRASAQPEPPLTLLPDERVLWTGYSAKGDIATRGATVALCVVMVCLGLVVVGNVLPGRHHVDLACVTVAGVLLGVCGGLCALLRPFCRAGYVVTTHRAVFLYSNGGAQSLSLETESDIAVEFIPYNQFSANRYNHGMIAFRHAGETQVTRELHGIADVWRVYQLLLAVRRYWATGRVQRVEMPECQCVRCGYSLTGSVSERCPECGRPAFPPSPTTDGKVTIAGPDPRVEPECAADEGNPE